MQLNALNTSSLTIFSEKQSVSVIALKNVKVISYPKRIDLAIDI